jgi:hypothetical protein
MTQEPEPEPGTFVGNIMIPILYMKEGLRILTRSSGKKV